MKSFVLLVIALVLIINLQAQFLSNQTDAMGMKQGKWISRYPNGKTKYEGNFKNNKPFGEWKRYHENGKLKAILHYRDSEKMYAELYDPEGSLFSKGNFIGKDKDSTWTYFGNNKIIARDSYRNGLKNGKSFFYSAEGKTLRETPWINGKVSGVVREFYPTGSLKSETVYHENQRQGECRVYFPTGVLQIEGKYDHDLYDGEWIVYKAPGVVKMKLEYKKGVLQNPGKYDSLEMAEFKTMEQMRGKIQDPEQFKDNPMELLNNQKK